MKDFISNNLDIILIILGICLSMMVIKSVTKILFRLIIVSLILTAAVIGYQVYSGTNIIDNISNTYCKTDNNMVKCECFVKPIISNLEERLTKEGLEALKENKLRTNTEFIKSYKIQEKEIKECFNELGESNGILEDILNDIKKSGFRILQ